jgi:hypothetical protein
MEKPLFEEVKEAGEVNYRPIAQKIVFEGSLIE